MGFKITVTRDNGQVQEYTCDEYQMVEGVLVMHPYRRWTSPSVYVPYMNGVREWTVSQT
jgi:hypothetical protein